MFRFSTARRESSSGSGYLRQLQRDIRSKVRGPTGIDTEERSSPWKALERALRALHTPAQVIPPLRSAIDGLVSILTVYEDALKARRDHETLISSLIASIEMLKQQLEHSRSARINDRILEIASLIEQEVLLIHSKRGQNRHSRIASVLGDEDAIQSYKQVEQLFHRIQLEVGMSAWRTAHEHLENERLENTNPAKLANYNSMLSTEINRRGCTENTRRAILSQLYHWSDNPISSRINWMSGMAGTGKTTIAYTLSDVLDTRGQLAASFFCTNTSPECRDAGRIIPTVAYQLARKSMAFQSVLCKALEQDPDLASRDIPTQFRHLFHEPLQKIEREIPDNLVVVIDALDECEDAQAVGQLLYTLFKYATTLPIKFFLTSRPELELANRTQRGLRTNGVCSTSHLHEIERSMVQSDIECYLRDELAFINPSPDDIKRLAEASGQLFIYAVTAVRYIRPGMIGVDHDERLATMLAVNSASRKRFAHIDALYSTVLSAALDNFALEADERDRILQVLWTVVCLQEPVHIEALREFTGLRNIRQTLIALQPLRSILYVSEKSSYISVLHQSFPDYLFNSERSGKFSCDSRKHNQFLAHQCFNLMKLQLKFNICDLESSFVSDRNVVDIKERIDNNISDSLAYACRYWGDHIGLADLTDKLLIDLQDFLCRRLLFWMEVMNLNEHIGTGVGALLKLHARLVAFRVSMPSDSLMLSGKLLEIASDASRFVASFAWQPVSLSTPHIYVSALPFAPSSSYIAKLYSPGMQRLGGHTTIVSGREASFLPSKIQHSIRPIGPGAYVTSTSAQRNPAQSSTTHPLSGNDHIGTILPVCSNDWSRCPDVYPRTNPPDTLPASGSRKPTMYVPEVRQASTTVIHTVQTSQPERHVPRNEGIFSAPHRSIPLPALTSPVHFDRARHLSGGAMLTEDELERKLESLDYSFKRRREQETRRSRNRSHLVPYCIEEEPEETGTGAPYGTLATTKSSCAPNALPVPDDVSGLSGLMIMSRYPTLGGQIPSLNYPWEIRSDGWILNRNAGLLLFISPDGNGSFRTFKSLNIPWQNMIPRIDWGKLYVGDQWKKCYYYTAQQ